MLIFKWHVTIIPVKYENELQIETNDLGIGCPTLYFNFVGLESNAGPKCSFS